MPLKRWFSRPERERALREARERKEPCYAIKEKLGNNRWIAYTFYVGPSLPVYVQKMQTSDKVQIEVCKGT